MCRAFGAYGENLGIAFQLVDDALDYSGRQALMGKTVGDDFREAKMTLPIILAHARADEETRAFWKRVIETGNQTEADLDRAITLVEETGAIQETMRRARVYADAAKAPFGHSARQRDQERVGGYRRLLRGTRLLASP